MDIMRMEDFAGYIIQCLEKCLARGMKLPFRMTVVSASGHVMALKLRMKRGRDPDLDFIAQHDPGGPIHFPIHVLVVDRRSRAAQITSSREGTTVDFAK